MHLRCKTLGVKRITGEDSLAATCSSLPPGAARCSRNLTLAGQPVQRIVSKTPIDRLSLSSSTGRGLLARLKTFARPRSRGIDFENQALLSCWGNSHPMWLTFTVKSVILSVFSSLETSSFGGTCTQRCSAGCANTAWLMQVRLSPSFEPARDW